MYLTSKKLIKNSLSTHSILALKAILCAPNRMLELVRSYYYDMCVFLKHSSIMQFFRSEQHLASWIDADIHKLEKGMALANPRPGFGKGVAERLVREIDLYVDLHGINQLINLAIEMLVEYARYTKQSNVQYHDLLAEIDRLQNIVRITGRAAGCDHIKKEEWLKYAQHDLSAFFKSRRSVRDFSEQRVTKQDLLKAIEMAMTTPTVCNRQSIKAHSFLNAQNVQRVLSCQSGNNGFGDKTPAVMVVTVNRECFFTAAERNQCWIDGGLYAMSLVYALHSLGLGTCCLNWSVLKEQDKALRNVVNIKDSEAVIMMIAIGHLKDEFRVAKSARKTLNHFATFDNIK